VVGWRTIWPGLCRAHQRVFDGERRPVESSPAESPEFVTLGYQILKELPGARAERGPQMVINFDKEFSFLLCCVANEVSPSMISLAARWSGLAAL